MSTRVFAVALLSLAGCFNPVAEPCKSKTRCPGDGGAVICSVGSTRECGTNIGICKPGRQTCGPDNSWGRCIGGVVPGVEQCDGLDNDCNGMVDEGVGKLCPLQKGVCAGASGACGSDAGCFSAYGPAYQVVEGACDGLDNDCDGVVDRSAAVNVSQSPGVVSRSAVAVKAPGTEATLVLWEEGSKVAARVVRADGTMSDVVAPSVTVEAATRAFAPAIAVNGTLVVAAWVEEVAMNARVMVASLDPLTGRSSLMDQGALLAMTATTPTEVAIAVDQAAGRLLLLVVDATGVRARGFSSTLPPPMGAPAFSIEPIFPVGSRISASAAGNGEFPISLDYPDGRVLRGWLSPTGVSAFSRQQPMGVHGHVSPGADGGLVSAYLAPTAPMRRVFIERCSIVPGDLSCAETTELTPVAESSALRLSNGRLVAWQEGLSSPRVVQSWVDRPDAGQSLGPGRRPAPVASTSLASVFFDTEGVVSTMVATDEIYLVRSCR